MAEPARKQNDSPDREAGAAQSPGQPGLQDLGGGGETSPRSKDHLRPVDGGGQKNADSPPPGKGGLKGLDGGGESSPRGRDHLKSAENAGNPSAGGDKGGSKGYDPANIRGREQFGNPNSLYNAGGDQADKDRSDGDEQDDDDSGGLYNPSSKADGRKKWRQRIGEHKKTAIGGGITGLIIASTFGGLTFLQGPLEFIHFAQLMDTFHFLGIQDAEDVRVSRIIRYIHDPSKPENTRLGIVGNIVADKYEKRLREGTGLKSTYTGITGQSAGYTVDRTHDNFKGKTPNQITDILANEFGVDRASIHVAPGPGGLHTISFNPDPGGKNTVKRYLAQARFSRAQLRHVGLSKISAYTGTRVLGTRAGWTFHPLRKLDAKVQESVLKAGKKGLDKLRTQRQAETGRYVLTGDEGALRFVLKPDAPPDPNSPLDQNARDAQKDSLKKKIGVGIAALAGVACVIRGLSTGFDQNKQDKAVMPMARMASLAMSEGSQVQSNKDIDTVTLGLDKDRLDAKDKDGNITSTWNQAKSIQAESGQPQTGPDIPKAGQVFDKGNPFDFLDNIPLLGTACGVLGSDIAVIIGYITGPVSSFFTQQFLDTLLPAIIDWTSGQPVNPLAAGADLGNYVGYGARISSNDQFASAGGVQLDSSQEQQIKTTSAILDKEDFQSHNVAYRLFNTEDHRTLLAQMVDKTPSGDVSQNVASVVRGFGGIFGSLLKVPAGLFSGAAHAADPPYTYHGLKKVGFSAKDLTDPTFENPFENTCYVVGCHNSHRDITGIFEDGGKAQQYTDLTKACTGDVISQDDNNVWQIEFATSAVNTNSPDYPADDCKSDSTEWKRVRFWIIDTEAFEGTDCSQNDSSASDQSCADLGFLNSAAGNNPADASTVGTGTPPTGSAKDLAAQIQPFIDSGKIQCDLLGDGNANCSDITNTAKGTSINGVGGCTVDGLQPELLGMLLKLLQMGHTFGLTAVCTDHHLETGEHSAGTAADFGTIDGTSMSGPVSGTWTGPRLTKAKKLDQDIASFMPKSTEFLQQQCHSKFPFLSGFQGASILTDPCHHQHVRAGV